MKSRLKAMARRWLTRRRYRGQRPKRGEPLKLHLGCGRDYWPGYINIDVDPLATYDQRLSFARVGRAFKEGSVQEAVMIHSLAYIRLWEARDLFRDLHRLLQPGGKVIIETTDLAKCSARGLEMKGNVEAYLEGIQGLYGFANTHTARREHYQPDAFGWAAWHLQWELEQAGFKEIAIQEPQTHERRLWRDTRVEAVR